VRVLRYGKGIRNVALGKLRGRAGVPNVDFGVESYKGRNQLLFLRKNNHEAGERGGKRLKAAVRKTFGRSESRRDLQRGNKLRGNNTKETPIKRVNPHVGRGGGG